MYREPFFLEHLSGIAIEHISLACNPKKAYFQEYIVHNHQISYVAANPTEQTRMIESSTSREEPKITTNSVDISNDSLEI